MKTTTFVARLDSVRHTRTMSQKHRSLPALRNLQQFFSRDVPVHAIFFAAVEAQHHDINQLMQLAEAWKELSCVGYWVVPQQNHAALPVSEVHQIGHGKQCKANSCPAQRRGVGKDLPPIVAVRHCAIPSSSKWSRVSKSSLCRNRMHGYLPSTQRVKPNSPRAFAPFGFARPVKIVLGGSCVSPPDRKAGFPDWQATISPEFALQENLLKRTINFVDSIFFALPLYPN